ncbi:MAG: glycosyltransferase, partial [Pseudomonadota bacterium]
IEAAGGEFCAFIDDDSVAEPTWLKTLAIGLKSTGAVAATGYVRGRNGISYQSQFATVDREAETHSEPSPVNSIVPQVAGGRAIKLVGTNMAVSRKVFVQLGGFDPGYSYFLEDTDLSIRISDAGLPMCVVPDAEVHHAYAASPRRTRLRAPINLYDIGKSTALFLRRHNCDQIDEIRARVLRRERLRASRHIVRGTCEPQDLRRLLASLEEGWRDGLLTDISPLPEIDKNANFQPVKEKFHSHKAQFSGLYLNRKRAYRTAAKMVNSGTRVSLFSFSLTAFRHHVAFTDSGVWLHTGGVYGPSEREQPTFRWCRFANRWKEEVARVAIARGLRD